MLLIYNKENVIGREKAITATKLKEVTIFDIFVRFDTNGKVIDDDILLDMQIAVENDKFMLNTDSNVDMDYYGYDRIPKNLLYGILFYVVDEIENTERKYITVGEIIEIVNDVVWRYVKKENNEWVLL